jgi:hypothetical protein
VEPEDRPETRLSLRELVERAKKLEERGRRIAFEREQPIGPEDLSFLDDLIGAANEMAERFEVFDEMKWSYLAQGIARAAEGLFFDAQACRAEGRRRKDCDPPRRMETRVEDVDLHYMFATGKNRCSWLRGAVSPYTYTAAVNDLTACFHRCVERLDELSSTWEVKGKCVWRV